jgi:hypothetical protein
MLSLVAIVGPWWFDVVFVPAKYSCSSPFIRVRDDFCGIPMSGVWIIVGLATRLIEILKELVTGETVIINPVDAMLKFFLYCSLVLILVLPLFTTWLLILRGDRKRNQIFHIVSWSLAVLCVIYIFGLNWPWALWGIWLYIGLAVGALILEFLFLALGIRVKQEKEHT